jgi:hypothetical protein
MQTILRRQVCPPWVPKARNQDTRLASPFDLNFSLFLSGYLADDYIVNSPRRIRRVADIHDGINLLSKIALSNRLYDPDTFGWRIF